MPMTSDQRLSAREIKQHLNNRLLEYIPDLMPKAVLYQNHFEVGDVRGASGKSLRICIAGQKKGLWHDFATGEHGDILHLTQLNQQIDFQESLYFAARWLGQTPSGNPAPNRTSRKKGNTRNLGPSTNQWDYHDDEGRLLARVFRYDPPEGKTFLPWNPRTGKYQTITPRPLYNRPGIKDSSRVVLVEGEKCAQALIDASICATTAMNGANAPIDKTDWAPLKGKDITIWPDNDQPGLQYARAAAQAIVQAGARSCFILTPPSDKPERWDAADALQEQDPAFDVIGFLASSERTPVEKDLLDAAIHFPDGVELTTEDGIARTFSDLYSHSWRYCSAWGKWLVWTGERWSVDHLLYIHYLIRNTCKAASEQCNSDRMRTRLASAATVYSVEKLSRCDPRHATATDIWDTDPWLLNTPGGVVNLATGQIEKHASTHLMTRMTTATPKGNCPLWITFINSICDNDQTLVDYLQKVIGYCLTGRTTEHSLFFFHGTGANGKSVLIYVLMTLLGNYATSTPVETLMDTRGEKHPTDLASLRGARLVSCVETAQGKRWNEPRLKTLTGGDKISARFMRQDFFEYTPQFKLIIAGNHKPSIRNIDPAMKRRLHLVPFSVMIPDNKQDQHLAEKLLKERDGILQWALEGCLRWQQEGLAQPSRVHKATGEYFDAEDELGQWLNERSLSGTHYRTGISHLYTDWKEWSEKTVCLPAP